MKLLNRQVEHPYLDALALLLVLIILGGSAFGYSRFLAVEAVKKQQSAKQQQRRTLISRFDKLMRLRDQFLVVSLDTDTVLGAVGNKVLENIAATEAWDKQFQADQAAFQDQVAAVKAHNAEEDNKYKTDPRYATRNYWTLPTPPSPPNPLSVDFTADIAALGARQTAIKAYIATLRQSQTEFESVELKPIYLALYKAAGDLSSAVARDVDILGGVVKDDVQGRVVNVAKSDMLKYNAQDAGLRSLNTKAVAFIKAQGLRLKDYDVPGGSDANPSDKSVLR